MKRWQAISESAAKQSKRSRIPEVHAVMNFKDAVEYAKLQDMILVPYENERGMEATREALEKVKPGQSISVFIGRKADFLKKRSIHYGRMQRYFPWKKEFCVQIRRQSVPCPC